MNEKNVGQDGILQPIGNRPPEEQTNMNFITKKHVSRRMVLRGVGAAMALPLLDSMVPAQTPLSQTAAVPPTRFTGIFVPHGMAPGYWIPEKVGTGFEFTPIMKPLEPLREQTVILSGMWSQSAEPPTGTTGADHWVARLSSAPISRRRRQAPIFGTASRSIR